MQEEKSISQATIDLAEQGKAFAQYDLGNAYWSGEGVAEDKREAVRWFHKAAEQGYPVAQFMLAVAYWNGEGTVANVREAYIWHSIVKASGVKELTEFLRDVNWRRFFYKSELNSAQKEAKRRLAAIDRAVSAKRDDEFEDESGDSVDENGDGIDAHANAHAVYTTISMEVAWRRVEAEQEVPNAQYFYGCYLYWGQDGEGSTATEKREAVRWIRKAAEQGHVPAQDMLGISYLADDGLVTDEREAYIWYSIAKANGNTAAAEALHETNWLAHLSQAEIRSAKKEAAWRLEDIDHRAAENERDLPRKYACAWRKMADQGNARAQFKLSEAYKSGYGVTEDVRAAMQWLSASAEQGLAYAQFILGKAYMHGDGVDKDENEAVRLWRQSAEQGDVDAEYSLGDLYWRGVYFDKDEREALRWFRKAAERGDARSQFQLAAAYKNGVGVDADAREAYIWAQCALASGFEDPGGVVRETNWHDFLTVSEIHSAGEEAASRMRDIMVPLPRVLEWHYA